MNLLRNHTSSNHRNRLLTTNWDTLLEKEIENLNLEIQPEWLADSYVYHLNGTIEEHENTSHLSPFLLEEDKYTVRHPTTEVNTIFNNMIWDKIFVVIGVSFECETDRFLLHNLNRVHDEVPIGESFWLVLNPDKSVLEVSSSRIKSALPRSNVYYRQTTFAQWVADDMPELQELGVMCF